VAASPPESIWFEQRHLVTFAETNVAGNVYFAHYFAWQGACRDALLAEFYPEFEQDLQRGFSLLTEFAHVDFHRESRLFDTVVIRTTVVQLSRTRIEFGFEYRRESDETILASGRQAVVYVNAQRQPSLMPERLYRLCEERFGCGEPPRSAATERGAHG
jgi:enediyne biosynthesis thioesterase